MRAEPKVQRMLLDLQELDSALDSLDHQLVGLPQTQRLNEIAVLRGQLTDELLDARLKVEDLQRLVTRSEGEVEQVKRRAQKDQELLDSGTITSPKQLQDLEHEITSLARRQSDLEDDELEVMQQLEDATSTVNDLVSRDQELSNEELTLTEQRSASTSEINVERSDVSMRRNTVRAQLPDELIAIVDKLRQDSPIATARLRGNQCGACQLQLSPVDLKPILDADPDEIVRCEECRAILVRDEVFAAGAGDDQ